MSARSRRLLLVVLLFLGSSPAHAQLEDRTLVGLVQTDLLEVQSSSRADALRWDAFGWIGRDYDKLWIKTEGALSLERQKDGQAEVQALYARLVAPFWFFQAGLRADRQSDAGDNRSRQFAVVGFQGLAPYRFDTETALFLSDEGDVSWRLTVTYDLWLTQRLLLQPRLDTNVAAQSAPEFGAGRGLNDLELGLRLRYEIVRKLAPYVGVSWTGRFGETAELARKTGAADESAAAVAGIRIWF